MDEDGDNVAPTATKNDAMSVEKIYQKKSQLEHILLRPDTYIGKRFFFKFSLKKKNYLFSFY